MREKNIGLSLISLVVFIFLLGPLLIIAASSFEPGTVLKFPPEGFSLRWYQNIFEQGSFVRTFMISVIISLAGNVLALLIGVPAAYAISRFRFKGRDALNAIFLSPVLIPGIVLGFTLMRYLIVVYQLPLYAGLLIGHTVIMLPFIIRVIGSSLSNFDFAIEEAALSLGAGRFATFFKVVLPNIKSGIIAAILIAFLESFNNVDISVFMTGPGVSTLPIQMLTYVENYFDPTIAAISVLLMVVTGAFMFLIERMMGLSYFTKR
ncbi:ABC transporter permease [Paenibacillus urinalis]|uniref:ABC transporter permease n=1 Tax=Paenibacillus urinalis TaxID=521520 RepID=A0AAX3MXS5_9BACL|nr:MULTISPECIES: ABC transporter permease [Paenibacillus]WDH82400.1 ABC transporter permease [Paenibacillus urinalis]WDH98459.1 ABC transporter permease [Paenibacillus urinalis]WDI02148.1 ABC transporter permease [Paenibacillus urinalis]GAK40150.1 spermidine/putrescine ABC transporter permease protein [Paenibacillus sp. TCA20]